MRAGLRYRQSIVEATGCGDASYDGETLQVENISVINGTDEGHPVIIGIYVNDALEHVDDWSNLTIAPGEEWQGIDSSFPMNVLDGQYTIGVAARAGEDETVLPSSPDLTCATIEVGDGENGGGVDGIVSASGCGDVSLGGGQVQISDISVFNDSPEEAPVMVGVYFDQTLVHVDDWSNLSIVPGEEWLGIDSSFPIPEDVSGGEINVGVAARGGNNQTVLPSVPDASCGLIQISDGGNGGNGDGIAGFSITEAAIIAAVVVAAILVAAEIS